MQCSFHQLSMDTDPVYFSYKEYCMNWQPRSVKLYVVLNLFLMVMLLGGSLPSAQAGPLKNFGYDTTAIGSGNSEYAYGSSYGVLASNPALMSRFKPQSGLEFIFYKNNLSINLMDKSSNTDVPITYYDTMVDSATSSMDRALPSIELRNKRRDTEIDNFEIMLGGGITYSFGIPGFRLGGMFVSPMPDQASITTYHPDEQEQYFSNQVHMMRFGEWSPMITGMLGASYAPPAFQYMSFGVAAEVSMSSVAVMDIYMPAIQATDYSNSNMNMKMSASVRPIVGIQAEPTDWMSIGLTWKFWNYLKVDGEGRMLLWSYNADSDEVGTGKWVPKRVSQPGHDYSLMYEPMEASLALGFRLAEQWQVQAVATWNNWSNYRNHHNETPEKSAQYLDIEEEDIENGTIVGIPSINGNDYAFSDTFNVNVGVSYQYLDWAQARMGFIYQMTPVPKQDGRTNYADSDTWCIAAGHRFDFPILESQFHAEFGLQFWQMIKRTVHKDPSKIIDEAPDDAPLVMEAVPVPALSGLQTNNPGFPGYSLEGWTMVGAFSISYEF